MAYKFQSCAKVAYMNYLKSSIGRFKHTATVPLGSSTGVTRTVDCDQKQNIHASAKKFYPAVPTLPLPGNMVEIFGNETGRFTPERARDITGPVLIYQSSIPAQSDKNTAKTFDFGGLNQRPNRDDSYVDSYDCTGSVSLNSSMQSNVPKPFSSDGKSMHLNMPGGQFAGDVKYIAEDMQNGHYATLFKKKNKKGTGAKANIIGANPLTQTSYSPSDIGSMNYSTDSGSSSSEPKKPVNEATGSVAMSKVDKLKRAVKDYGSTVIVFHVGISLASLGGCYLAVSSGLDVPSLIERLGFNSGMQFQSLVSNSSTFVVAYGIHKLFAPLRISLTLGVTPFLVRYLRRIGFIKAPKP